MTDQQYKHNYIIDIALLSLIILGIIFRFSWRDWSQGTNLHPDEYGLTNTLTQLRLPDSIGEYFNTRISPISPYQKYDIHGQPTDAGPDNRMRWGQLPIIIYRWAGEITGNTGYNEIRLLGRTLSAAADAVTLLLTFLIGKRLYGRKVGLLGTAFSALAVLQIQQSHFMTADNIGVLFSTASIYALVRIAQGRCITRSPDNTEVEKTPGRYGIRADGLVWYGLFGVFFGMALSSRINLLPLGGLLLAAAFINIADLKIKTRRDLHRIFSMTVVLLVLSLLVTMVTFRVTQPMSFRAESGDTTLLTFSMNSDWVDSMEVASMESRGVGGGPPSEQWAHRPMILFPLINMVVWGMGLPLGLASWAGFTSAGWQVFKSGKQWRSHLLILLWAGGYFLFMGTRFVKSIRYFLPIYPFLALLAAWVLVDAWNTASSGKQSRVKILQALISSIVVLGTLVWAVGFVKAVYLTDHTRIQASRWIYENIPPGSVIANETWDEGLPLPIDGHNPFGDRYQGIMMEVRWYDDENKREMFLDRLEQADYIILPSQRAIWSVPRIPLTYPMTMLYYQTLFDGRLGFDLAAAFSSPFQLGKLQVSDVGGTWAWGRTPSLPLFNRNLLAAEEAFSVYDHPPVWIFQKRADFDIQAARELLESVDLSGVVIQSPGDAQW